MKAVCACPVLHPGAIGMSDDNETSETEYGAC
jgi:hypothetical protein